MAVEVALSFKYTLIAAADLSTHQYKFVSIDTNGLAALTGAGLTADGVLQDAPIAGRAGCIAGAGISKVVVGVGGLTPGQLVAAGANGTAVVAASGNQVLGKCYVGGLATQIASVRLYDAGHKLP